MKSYKKIKQTNFLKNFPITGVCRTDLEDIGFNTKNVDDSTMERLASKMANAYCENVFWIDLEIIAEHLGIKKRKKINEKTKK